MRELIVYSKEKVVQLLRLRAWGAPYRGHLTPAALRRLRYHTVDCPDGARVMFTRDEGHHGCGWWKNPDYERCFHLSISYRDPETLEPADQDLEASREWCRLFFEENVRWLWAEPPSSEEGVKFQTWHFRLFCDPSWDPILPRGEVYTRRWTPPGYKTWSELQGGERQVEA